MLNTLKKKLTTALSAVVLASGLTVPAAPVQAQDFWIGQLVPVGFNFCPRATAPANGQLLPISSNSALFSLLGTFYGGDGRTTFALPDLRGRSAIGFGSGPGLTTLNMGTRGGAEFHTLSVAEMPAHSHTVNSVQAVGDRRAPNSDFLAGMEEMPYHNGPANATMDPGMIGNTGGGQSFQIRDPYLAIQWCVVTQGIYPSRS